MTTSHSTPIALNIIGPASWTPTDGVLSYATTDPFAVSLTFVPGGIVWILGRELLRDGLKHPVGAGDVRIWPTVGETGALFIHLRSTSGEALMECDHKTAATFLNETLAMVPLGQEELFTGIDAELDTLGGDHGDVL